MRKYKREFTRDNETYLVIIRPDGYGGVSGEVKRLIRPSAKFFKYELLGWSFGYTKGKFEENRCDLDNVANKAVDRYHREVKYFEKYQEIWEHPLTND